MWSLPITGSHVFILHIALFNANLIYLYAEKREPGLCWFVYELQPKQWRKWMKPVWSFLTVVYLHFITKPRWTHQILEFQELDERFINNHLERWSQKLNHVEFYWLSFLLLPWQREKSKSHKKVVPLVLYPTVVQRTAFKSIFYN